MKLHYLPKYSGNWQWVASIKGLEEIDVSFVDTDTELRHLIHAERIHVHDESVECTGLSNEGTLNILRNLSKNMMDRVSFTQYDMTIV